MRSWMKGFGAAVWVGVFGVSAGASLGRADEPMAPHETFLVESAVLGEARRINVYKPPDYDGNGAARYPVLYMLDGGEKEDFPHVSMVVDKGLRSGELPSLILVGIENTERRRDLTPPTEVESDRKIAPRVGGSAAFRGFLSRELRPEIERRYRVTPETGIIGESLAGLFVIETLFEAPGLFQSYIALSPSLWWNHEEIVRRAAARLKSSVKWRADFVLVAAKEDELITARLADAFRAAALPGVKFQFAARTDLLHQNIYRSVAPWVLRQVFPAGWKREKKE